ncbi:hypothetical protein BD560DRAFT_428646 [Blakeslea trispora]|nr:hypothetical protein BD560DRAFT_428646 [Blakeslea trispora]
MPLSSFASGGMSSSFVPLPIQSPMTPPRVCSPPPQDLPVVVTDNDSAILPQDLKPVIPSSSEQYFDTEADNAYNGYENENDQVQLNISQQELPSFSIPPVDLPETIEIVSSSASSVSSLTSDSTSTKEPASSSISTSHDEEDYHEAVAEQQPQLASDIDMTAGTRSDRSSPVDERIDATDLIQDVHISEAENVETTDVAISSMSLDPSERPPTPVIQSQTINIQQSQVVLVQAPVTQVTVVVSDRADHGSSETPPSPPVINSTADVPVDVVELESISDTVIATPQAIDLPRRYLIKDSHDTTTASTTSTTTTITPTSIIPPIPPASTSAPSTSNSPVQRRTTLRRGGNVMPTNSGSEGNHLKFDFADTSEIPQFLRNWNSNKKRKFKPITNSNRPNKRQRLPEL